MSEKYSETQIIDNKVSYICKRIDEFGQRLVPIEQLFQLRNEDWEYRISFVKKIMSVLETGRSFAFALKNLFKE